jgi:hypothetical protein
VNYYKTVSQVITTCFDSYVWRGKYYTKSGIYSDTVIFPNNCDSIYVVDLIITPQYFNFQPLNQYKNIGNSAIFSVQFTGSQIQYQWQSGSDLNWFNLSNLGPYSGVNTNTLAISNMQPFYDGYKYRCIVKDGNCIQASEFASLFICPLISEQPLTKYCSLGGDVIFTLKSDIPKANFQWQADNGLGFVNLNNQGFYSGTNTPYLKVSPVNLGMNKQRFRCIVTYGNCRDTADNAVLNILEKASSNPCNSNSFISVYPNPTNSYVNIIIPSDLLGSEYQITNDKGQVIKIGKITEEIGRIELKEFPSGVYILTIGNNKKDCFKIVKVL